MRVLMLGWEYPPHISGGLGTACEGLTQALAQSDVEITFIVPELLGGEESSHMALLDAGESAKTASRSGKESRCQRVDKRRIPAALKPYWKAGDYKRYRSFLGKLTWRRKSRFFVKGTKRAAGSASKKVSQRYGRDIFEEVTRYTKNLLLIAEGEDFDLIHCHDWMTYPAGVAIAERTGKPLIVHVHSLESDRSGRNADPRIQEIEYRGMNRADVIIAVSFYTRCRIGRIHAFPLKKIAVVHNGIYKKRAVQYYRSKWNSSSKIVLFLGRVTYQKGPEYFVEVAPRVIPHVPDVLFVMAGTGDMLPRLAARVNELGIGRHFHFTGFLREKEVERMLSVADLYVMPSVSEPFGLSALEAIAYDTPVVISKQSGVAEVISNALKFDYWDLDRLGDLIINGLLHDELRADMVRLAREELESLRWDAAAEKTLDIYNSVLRQG